MLLGLLFYAYVGGGRAGRLQVLAVDEGLTLADQGKVEVCGAAPEFRDGAAVAVDLPDANADLGADRGQLLQGCPGGLAVGALGSFGGVDAGQTNGAPALGACDGECVAVTNGEHGVRCGRGGQEQGEGEEESFQGWLGVGCSHSGSRFRATAVCWPSWVTQKISCGATRHSPEE